MGVSHRIRTEIGINKTINVELEQDFNFLEILSFKVQQADIYNKACADYGVLIGRVTANNGFGLPNARVSIFVPIEDVDKSNPLITSIYPYTSPEDKNEDGYRYNLLPYEKSYETHAATGTFPTLYDALTDKVAIEIFDKYYKFTVKTNDSGDYMIMGAPLGTHLVFLDLDLSDIGEFSLTPQDLIRMGRATEAQVAGANFKTSNDLNSLPQIVSLSKSVDISPLWGDPSICQIAITRTDFDLRDDASIDIQPTAAFMGSIFSSPDSYRIRKNCKPRDNMGNLCGLITQPGQILAIRHTIKNDTDGNPILEQYQLEQSGNIIDAEGTWLTELPMNLEYVITNEFGETILSNDPTVGIPTKAKYRFKIKWKQPPTLTEQTRRGYFLVPNVREYGWSSPDSDPVLNSSYNIQNMLRASYYFGLDWSGYTNGFYGQYKIDKLNDAINCADTFYEFKYNRVYTVSSLIDEYKNGAKGRFVGIKEIDDSSCEDSVNKFPVNDGFRNFDLLFFVFSILIFIIQPIAIAVLVVAHIILWLYNAVINFICSICEFPLFGTYPFRFICRLFGINCDERNYTIRLPMITYPDCTACENCRGEITVTAAQALNFITPTGVMSYFSDPQQYYDKFLTYVANATGGSCNWYNYPVKTYAEEDYDTWATYYSTVLAGNTKESWRNTTRYKIPFSDFFTTQKNVASLPINGYEWMLIGQKLPLGEAINNLNARSNYDWRKTSIKVKFSYDSPQNSNTYHYDNVLICSTNQRYEPGTILTVVNPNTTKDKNCTYSADTYNADGTITTTFGISGTSYNSSGETNVNVTYKKFNIEQNTTVNYYLPYGSENTQYKYPADREYFQVITAITVSELANLNPRSFSPSAGQEHMLGLQDLFYDSSQLTTLYFGPYFFEERCFTAPFFYYKDFFNEFGNQTVLILQRGVDPYSPVYNNKFYLGNLFGFNENNPNFIVNVPTKLNIPIQAKPSFRNVTYNYLYKSYFFKPSQTQFITYVSDDFRYYGKDHVVAINNTPAYPYQTVNNNIVSSNGSNHFANITYDVYGYGGGPWQKYFTQTNLKGVSFMYAERTNGGWHTNSDGLPLYCPLYPNDLSVGDCHQHTYDQINMNYYSNILPSDPTTISSSLYDKIIFRQENLPSSDALDQENLWQQNLNFAIYTITEGESFSTPSFTIGADIVPADLEGLPGVNENINVVESVGSCEKMVSLECYEGIGWNFQINQNCTLADAVENGCYMFMRRPLKDLRKDIRNFSEYTFRFKFFYGLCRGILSQSFMNNWVNGTLYAFPIQVDTKFNSLNQPVSNFCKNLVYFDTQTTNFYYRSSPYNHITKKFTGKRALGISPTNELNLLFPTTILNMGVKAPFYKDISTDVSSNDYIMTQLDTSSYADTSDLVNLFVVSRITDEGFLKRIVSFGDNSINQLFSRDYKRIDGDLAQLLSINSEVGVIKFSPEFYETQQNSTSDPVNILGTANAPIMAVWFSSTTEDLQLRDNITPGRVVIRPNNLSTYVTNQYGIKSQIVPMYNWKLNNTTTIFGNQYNTWYTNSSAIVQNRPYQSLDRLDNSVYFYSNTSPSYTDIYERGYIFSVDNNGVYSQTGAFSSRFVVGAPYHFYFGVVKGQSAMDKFKTKYAIVE